MQGAAGPCRCLLTPPQEPAWPPPPCWAGRRDTAWPPSRPRTPHRDPAPEGAPSRQQGASSGERARAGSCSPRPARCRPRRERRGGASEERRREGGRGVRAPGNSLLHKLRVPGRLCRRRCLPAPCEQEVEKGEGPAGVRLGRPPSPRSHRASAARGQVSSWRGLTTQAADPSQAALGPGVRPLALRLLEAPPLLPLSACGAGSREVGEKLLPSPGPAGRPAGGRACLLGALPACPQPRSPPRPDLPDPASVLLGVQPTTGRLLHPAS